MLTRFTTTSLYSNFLAFSLMSFPIPRPHPRPQVMSVLFLCFCFLPPVPTVLTTWRLVIVPPWTLLAGTVSRFPCFDDLDSGEVPWAGTLQEAPMGMPLLFFSPAAWGCGCGEEGPSAHSLSRAHAVNTTLLLALTPPSSCFRKLD